MSPAPCQRVTDLWCLTATASSTVHSGVVALMIPAVADPTDCSATANSRYGIALANSAATTICPQTGAERGTSSRLTRTTGNNTAAPSASRAKVTSTGGKPRSASLIQRNEEPQMSASRANRGSTDRFTGRMLARIQFEPVGQVFDLVIYGGGRGLVEGHVLVDRVDPEHAGLAVGDGVELPDEPVAVEDRQREVPPAAFGGRLVH